MNLVSVKRELENLKALARARSASGCVCEYVDVIDGLEPTTQQQQMLTKIENAKGETTTEMRTRVLAS